MHKCNVTDSSPEGVLAESCKVKKTIRPLKFLDITTVAPRLEVCEKCQWFIKSSNDVACRGGEYGKYAKGNRGLMGYIDHQEKVHFYDYFRMPKDCPYMLEHTVNGSRPDDM